MSLRNTVSGQARVTLLAALAVQVLIACGGGADVLNRRSDSGSSEAPAEEADLSLTKAELSDIKAMNTRLDSQIELAKSQLLQAVDSCKKALQTRTKIGELMGPVAPELAALSQSIDSLKALIAAKQVARQAKSREISDVQGELDGVKESISSWGKDFADRLRAERAALRTQIDAKSTELATVLKAIEGVLNANSFDEAKYTELSGRRNLLVEEIERLEARLNHVKDTLTQATTVRLADLKARRDALETRLAALKARLNPEIAAIDAEIKTLGTSLSDKQGEAARDREATGLTVGSMPADCEKLGVR